MRIKFLANGIMDKFGKTGDRDYHMLVINTSRSG
jgi:hypothetical protein